MAARFFIYLSPFTFNALGYCLCSCYGNGSCKYMYSKRQKNSHYTAVVWSGCSEAMVILRSHYALTTMLVWHASLLTNYYMVLLQNAGEHSLVADGAIVREGRRGKAMRNKGHDLSWKSCMGFSTPHCITSTKPRNVIERV